MGGTEIWKDVIGFESLYMVSNIGRVKSLDRMTYDNKYAIKGFMLKYGRHPYGYHKYTLCKDGKMYYTTAHKLVAKAFLSNKDNLPCINHIDNNPDNNRVENLEWCTFSHNSKQAYKSGNLSKLGELNSMSKLLAEEALFIFNSTMDKQAIASQFNISIQSINDIKAGRRWSHVTGLRHHSVKKRLIEQ